MLTDHGCSRRLFGRWFLVSRTWKSVFTWKGQDDRCFQYGIALWSTRYSGIRKEEEGLNISGVEVARQWMHSLALRLQMLALVHRQAASSATESVTLRAKLAAVADFAKQLALVLGAVCRVERFAAKTCNTRIVARRWRLRRFLLESGDTILSVRKLHYFKIHLVKNIWLIFLSSAISQVYILNIFNYILFYWRIAQALRCYYSLSRLFFIKRYVTCRCYIYIYIFLHT